MLHVSSYCAHTQLYVSAYCDAPPPPVCHTLSQCAAPARPLCFSVTPPPHTHPSALSAPLLQSGREVDELLAASGEECCVLERLLRCANSEAHEQMSLALWEAGAGGLVSFS